jgi:hypothetical protein
MPGELLGQIASNAAALAIALVGWGLHIRTCRSTIKLLQEENRRLVEALSRALEMGQATDWRQSQQSQQPHREAAP